MSFPPDLRPKPPAISTREEFLRLQRERATPADQLNLTPDRSTALAVNSGMEAEKEKRVQFLERRLERASFELQFDHTLARLDGHVKADFDHSR